MIEEMFDSLGNKLYPRGPEHIKAGFLLHVCYDGYYGLYIFRYETARARELCDFQKRIGARKVRGTKEGIGVAESSAGYIFTPEDLEAEGYPFTPQGQFALFPLGARAELDAASWLRGGPCWAGVDVVNGSNRTDEEKKQLQYDGIDLIVLSILQGRWTADVKARSAKKEFMGLFVQTDESNPIHSHK